MPEPIVTVTDVTKVFPLRGKQEVRALDGVSLTVERGEYLSIMGPSGSGKSTLFNIIGALDKPTTGDVRIGELSLPNLKPKQLAYVRGQHLGYIFQAYNLIPSLTAIKNVALPRVFAGATPEEADEVAAQKLEEVGLGHRLGLRLGDRLDVRREATSEHGLGMRRRLRGGLEVPLGHRRDRGDPDVAAVSPLTEAAVGRLNRREMPQPRINRLPRRRRDLNKVDLLRTPAHFGFRRRRRSDE